MPVPQYFNPDWITPSQETLTVDICVYGGTASGIIAALTALREGKTAVLLHPGLHLGGMTTGGLSFTDVGNKDAIGGAARQFYRDLGPIISKEEDWKFTPGNATRLFDKMIEDAGLDVRRAQFLDHAHLQGTTTGPTIQAVTMLGGLTVNAKMFIDATYEGDLMAAAGCDYHVGRESNSVYGERYNGRQVRWHHQFGWIARPFIEKENKESGLLPQVEWDDDAPEGTGDHRVQAYCFRMCMTDNPDNRIPFEKPADFNPLEYELLARICSRFDAWELFGKFDRLSDKTKTDTNNHGPISTDYIGMSWQWPDGNYELREQLFQKHVTYQKGYHWFCANDQRMPAPLRERYATWGLAKDEFTETENWPHQLYVREGRRMVADYVITEHDCMSRVKCDDPVGMAAYNMDSHNCTRLAVDGNRGITKNEGDVQVHLPRPYPLSYRAIIPKQGQAKNLLVPVACSTSHIAFGSLRMEPVFMILGESAALAASLALAGNGDVHDVPYNELRDKLLAAGQVLNTAAENVGHANPVDD